MAKLKSIVLGALYECEFEAEALRRGFVPHRPAYPTEWDFLVVCPKGILKVQVKGTSVEDKESFKIMTATGRRKKKVIGDEVDVIACWVDPCRVWYLIPTSQKLTLTVRLFASNPRSASKYEKYRENWAPFYGHE